MPGFTALLDSCVLYPAPVRDLLIETANTHVYRARWSNHIHDEWTANVLKNNPKATAELLARTRQLMNDAVPDALITGYEDLWSLVVGMHIRNRFGLWEADNPFTDASDPMGDAHPDQVSQRIIEQVWEHVQMEDPARPIPF